MSVTLDEALVADRERRIPEALDAYWNVVLHELGSRGQGLPGDGTQLRRAFFNLVAIYFECSDFGFAAACKVPDDLCRHAELSALGVLAVAERACGTSDELEFWRETILCRGTWFESDVARWDEMLRRHPDSGVIALGHMVWCQRPAKAALVDELVGSLASETTVRAAYLKSIAASARQRPRN